MEAVWRDVTLAHSKATEVVEGNHYFPSDSVDRQYFRSSGHTSFCPWKGTAHYYHLEVDGEINENAAWYYPEPKPEAEHIRGHVAFWNGVQVTE